MAGRQRFEGKLSEVESLIVEMAKGTKQQLTEAVEALYQSNIEAAEQIVENDKLLDKLDRKINERAIVLLAREQPVATDLRRLVVAIRISTDLERMADNAKNIARATIRLGKNHGLEVHSSIDDMRIIAEDMIELAIKAYENEDITLARKLSEMDDQLDHIYAHMMTELLTATSDKQKTQLIIQMAFSGRYVERIGDHATNIGEDVMYLVKGESFNLN
ncbi:phosphate transport system protein [Gracilibacillus halotolerans]|uniref:Phosphate-specific transport system accessory protein PhoU n=1 Tax=Gracilibacillus halotolerans TaxID=74386 RepID=A0A841RLG0_9BACI|nr:phosphate signaling complex protein PhoU [Gracilibacillus halotolerans]MBB6511794.1 phosphate transport system protein [Gracilibacillus halotolerans]